MYSALEKERLFNELYNDYHKLVYSVCYKYSKDRELCEDCLQDTYTTVWNQIEKFMSLNTATHQRNLICVIARSTIIDKLRKQSVAEKYNEKIYTFYKEFDEDAFSNFSANSEDIKNAMKNCLDEREQDMLTLKFYFGYTNNEISEMFGVKKARTSQIITGALAKMKKYLGEDYKNGQT